MKKLLTLALTVVLVASMLFVDAGAYAVDLIYEINAETKKPTETVDYEATVEQYLTLEFATAEDKLETMTMMLEKDGYQLWVDELTGEVATKDLASGQILFSNPYDIGATYKANKGPSASTKKKIFSQIMIDYDDNGTDKKMYSFEEAAMRGQIKVKNIKNGIRIEYSVGREETRMLVPKVIEKSAFETKILDVFAAEVNEISKEAGLLELNWRDYEPITKRSSAASDSGNSLWFNFMQLFAYYQLKAKSECTTQREEYSLYAAYPICKTLDVYVFSTDATQTETIKIENYIKTYVPSYTFEQLEIDHALTEYEGSDKNPALFKLSLEYTLDELGMSVRCPVNGLRFNESLYKLTYLSILPYMGAAGNYLLGNTDETFTGYNFFPDGSGSIFRHEDLAGTSTTTINAKVFGFDYAYNEITGNHAEVVRYPVFGIVSNYHDTRKAIERVMVAEEMKDPVTGEVIAPAEYEEVEVDVPYNEDRGFVAIIEEGDALAELSTYHEGSLSKYNSISMLFYPRPKDSYNLKNAISVGANATWTVVSSRKYVGNYKIRYIMLTDDRIAEEKKLEKHYEVSWMGMADAYRDYMYGKGELAALQESDVKADIPAYIETFGTTETVEKILSLPVNVMTPLTSFEDVKTMYDELSGAGVSNIKFKLTGYANGGIFASVPYRLKWEKAVGGADGFEDLVAYSNEKGFQIFPDFDFAYVRASSDEWFDGLNIKDHIVKSINNTYMSRRYYSATKQTMMGRFELAISSAYYAHFYEKLSENLLKYYKEGVPSTISVATLGSALNSDFDEDEPYNREDSKKSTIKALASIDSSFDNVMTESGNSYSWKYVDYILNLPLDSSRYTKSGASVPFLGVVLHGSKQFSGAPLNMEGNIGYSLLKAIENGAGLYFILCYQNYAILKENNVLSQYYSVRYDILKNDIVKYYTLVNNLTRDLQTSLITTHEFLIGERVPDADEIEADKKAEAEKIAAELEAAEKLASKEKAASLLNGRVNAEADTKSCMEWVADYYEQAIGYDQGSVTVDESGRVTVNVGMKTLVERVLALTDDKNKKDEIADAATLEKAYRDNALALWAESYNPFNGYMASGRLSAYTNLITARDKNVKTLETSQTTLDTRTETLQSNLDKAINAGLAKLSGLLNTYNTAATAEEKTAALNDLVTYAGSVENAEKYVDLTAKAAKAAENVNGFAIKYAELPEYSALYTAKTEADVAYNAAVEADKAKIEGEAYKAAEKALADANDALNARIAALTATVQNCDTQLAEYSETENEYKELVKLKDSAAAELAALKDETKSNSYRDAVAAAQAAVIAAAPEAGTLKVKASEATEKLNAFVADYTATYADSEAYKNATAAAEAADKELADFTEVLAAISPAKKAYDEYVKVAEERNAADVQKTKLTNAYTETAKYKELKSAADQAAADFAEITAKLLADIENDSKYKTLKKTYEDAKAALETYTLGYTEKEDYQELAKTLEDATAALDAFVKSYEKEDEYKKLKDTADKNDKAYETAYNAVKDIVNGTSSAKMTDAQYKALSDAIDAKAKSDAALNIYIADAETAAKAADDYRTLLADQTAAQKAVDTYLKAYTRSLDDAVTESKDAEKPEETLGGKYSAAQKAFNDAESYYMYYTGEKSVPTTLKNVDVYSAIIKTKKEYTDAETKKKNADTALKSYTSGFSGNVAATTELAISQITDAEQKALNEQYRAADAAYKAADEALKPLTDQVKAIDSALNSALTSYYTACRSVTTNEVTLAASETDLVVTSLKAEYDAATDSYNKVTEAYNAASEKAADADTAYVLASTEDGNAVKAQNDAIKGVKTQITKTNNVITRINYYVAEARKNLSDSDFAVETIMNNNDYAAALKEDLKASHAKVVEYEKQIHADSDKAIAAAKNALTAANKIIATDIDIKDPYDDSGKTVVEDTQTAEDEEKSDEYEFTKYTDDSGNIVRIGYSNGVVFFLNYNYFAVVTVYGDTTYELPAYGGIRINSDGTSVVFTTTLAEAAE